VLDRKQDKKKKKREDYEKVTSGISVAIPSLFRKPSYPTIPREPLRREQPLRNLQNSGWRDSNPSTLEIGEKILELFSTLS
jgi:hypothetical protein